MFLENHFQTRHCIEKIIGHEFTYPQNWGFHYKSMKIDDLEYEWHHSTTHNLSPYFGLIWFPWMTSSAMHVWLHRSLRGRLCVRAHATAAAVGGQDGTSPRHLPVGGLQPFPNLYRRKGNAIHVYCIQQSCVHTE